MTGQWKSNHAVSFIHIHVWLIEMTILHITSVHTSQWLIKWLSLIMKGSFCPILGKGQGKVLPINQINVLLLTACE